MPHAIHKGLVNDAIPVNYSNFNFLSFCIRKRASRDLLDTAGSFCQRSGAETVPILYILTHVADKINGDIAVAGVRRTDDLVSDVES